MYKDLNYYLFSPNVVLAQKLYYLGDLKAVYFEKRHLNQKIINFCGLRNIPYYATETLSELEKFLPVKTTNSIGISFGVGFIFKNKHIQLFERGIWNIHAGKLPNNRGRHPIGWSFINNDKYFTVSLHSINEQIDQGELIYEENIERDINDDLASVTKKIDNVLNGNFLIKGFENYQKGKMIILEEGKYNKNLTGQFNEINSKDYSAPELFSIFKSQLIYGPLNVDGVYYDDCNFYSEFMPTTNCTIIEANDGIKLSLHFANGGSND